jgi:hypothetical protein
MEDVHVAYELCQRMRRCAWFPIRVSEASTAGTKTGDGSELDGELPPVLSDPKLAKLLCRRGSGSHTTTFSGRALYVYGGRAVSGSK